MLKAFPWPMYYACLVRTRRGRWRCDIALHSGDGADRQRGGRYCSARHLPRCVDGGGGDTISCRRLYGEFFAYHPAFKVWLATNSKSIIRGTDHGIWRRIRLIPFTRRFTGRAADPALPAKLQVEATGTLAWAVSGCLTWQWEDLGSSPAMQEATEAYRLEQDRPSQFLVDRTVECPQVSARCRPLSGL